MASYAVVFSQRAERQLGSLFDYIAENSGEARAEAFVSEIIDDCRDLSTFPERGILREDLRPNLRIKGFRRRVTIAFSVDRLVGVIIILGVFYGGQDFEKILAPDAE